MAHEFGHGAGGLADEYTRDRTYTGGEPGGVNLTTNTNRATLKWGKFVRASTAVPTTSAPSGWDSSQDVGLFEGGGAFDEDIYRPVQNCRMRGNSPPFCPVCYTEMKRKHHGFTGRTFENAYAGDFSGDGKTDLLVHNGNSVMIYRSNGSQLDVVFSAVERVPGSWQFAPADQFYVGDFNGDGKDEVVVYNATDWHQEYLGLLADDGNDGLRLIARYDDAMPGWQFHKNDKFFVADVDGDGKKDLFVFNGADWSAPYLGILRATGTGFQLVRRYDKSLAGWQMAKEDQFFVGDFSGDGQRGSVGL